VEEDRSAAGGDLSVNPLVPNVALLRSLIFDRRCTLKSVRGFYMPEWRTCCKTHRHRVFGYPPSLPNSLFRQNCAPKFSKTRCKTNTCFDHFTDNVNEFCQLQSVGPRAHCCCFYPRLAHGNLSPDDHSRCASRGCSRCKSIFSHRTPLRRWCHTSAITTHIVEQGDENH
jgi:hypothetical protein